VTVGDDALVSVIMPVYQRRYCAMDAVESVLAQSHRNLECVVVDDGSTDGSSDLLAEAARSETRIRFFAQPHRGVSAARNRALREANGQYVTFLDSDDLMPAWRVTRQLELLAELDCDVVLGNGRVSVMPNVAPPVWLEARPDWRYGQCWLSMLVATESIRAVGGFDESLPLGEDTDLIVRLRSAGFRIHAVDEEFVVRRYFGDNLTYDMDVRASGLRHAIRRNVARMRAAQQPQ
jgi:glycosyltransferase involved in cell wall biosynthesis